MSFYRQALAKLRATSPYFLIALQMLAATASGFSKTIFELIFLSLMWSWFLYVANSLGQLAIMLTWLPFIILIALIGSVFIGLFCSLVVALPWILTVGISWLMWSYPLNSSKQRSQWHTLIFVSAFTGVICGLSAEYFKNLSCLGILPITFCLYCFLLWRVRYSPSE